MKPSSWHDRRVWLGGGVIAAVLIVVVSWLLLIGPELSSASQLRSQAASTDLQNTATQAKNAALARQSRDISTLKSAFQRALEALPPDSGLPALTEEMARLAEQTGVHLSSINVGAVAAAGSTSSTAVGADAGAPATKATGAAQYSIPVTVVSTGRFAQQAAFLKALENGPRRTLVTSTQVTAFGGSHVASVDGSTNVATQLTVFCAPMSRSQLAKLTKILAAGS